MSDLIQKSELIEEVQKYFVNNSIHKNDLAEVIAKLPTVEAKPVVHGEWIPVKHSRGGHECSVCNSYAPSYQSGREYISKYCPYCGADMRGGKND